MEERESPDRHASKGKNSAQQVINALILLGCDDEAHPIKQAG